VRETMPEEDVKINCPTFQKQEPGIERITAEINEAKEFLKKAEFAEELEQEVDVLLSCSEYDQNSRDCNNCHFIASVRKKTARLIMKAKKLT